MVTSPCEWCGRSGHEIPLHVRHPQSGVDFAVPTLCDVCAGLLGFFRDKDMPRPEDPTFREFTERRAAEAQETARQKLFALLSANYTQRGRPVPAWESRPTG